MHCSLHWGQGACIATGHQRPHLYPRSIQRHPNATSCLLLRQIHSPFQNSSKVMPKYASSTPLFQASLPGGRAGKIPALSIFSQTRQVLSDQKLAAVLCSSHRTTQSCHLLMPDAQALQWQQVHFAGHLPPLWPLLQEDTQPQEAPRFPLGSADRQQRQGHLTFFIFSSRPRCTQDKASAEKWDSKVLKLK